MVLLLHLLSVTSNNKLDPQLPMHNKVAWGLLLLICQRAPWEAYEWEELLHMILHKDLVLGVSREWVRCMHMMGDNKHHGKGLSHLMVHHLCRPLGIQVDQMLLGALALSTILLQVDQKWLGQRPNRIHMTRVEVYRSIV